MLVGIDPDYIERLEYMGATFIVRPLPYGKWGRLRQENIDAYRRSLTRAIKSLKEEGVEPDEEVAAPLVGSPEKKMSRAAWRAMADGLYREQLAAIYVQEARWSLVGHSGVLNSKGEPVPFETISATYEGESYQILSLVTERWYRVNGYLLEVLHSTIWKVNELEGSEKKV